MLAGAHVHSSTAIYLEAIGGILVMGGATPGIPQQVTVRDEYGETFRYPDMRAQVYLIHRTQLNTNYALNQWHPYTLEVPALCYHLLPASIVDLSDGSGLVIMSLTYHRYDTTSCWYLPRGCLHDLKHGVRRSQWLELVTLPRSITTHLVMVS